jgi:hypothetical protein
MENIIFPGNISLMPFLTRGRSRAINAENRTGEKGKGGMTANGALGPGRKGSPCLRDIKSGEIITLADITGPGMITHIWITVDKKTDNCNCFVLRDLVLRIYWDDEKSPSVETPLGDFFCCGFAIGSHINSALVSVIPAIGLNCFFQMPFKKKARIVLENQHDNPIPAFFYQIDYCIYEKIPETGLYFHASYRQERITEKGKDYIVLDNVKGRGTYLGTFIALTTLERYWWGEGEFKFFIDGDKEYPTICGTGMEDYFGGSWSFAFLKKGITRERNYCTPYMGYPFYANKDEHIQSPYHNDDCPPMRDFYRWHIPDPIFFEEDLKVTVQQIGASYRGLFERQDDISSVAYWYQEENHQPFSILPEKKDRWPR